MDLSKSGGESSAEGAEKGVGDFLLPTGEDLGGDPRKSFEFLMSR